MTAYHRAVTLHLIEAVSAHTGGIGTVPLESNDTIPLSAVCHAFSFK